MIHKVLSLPSIMKKCKHTYSNNTRFIKDLVELKELVFKIFLALPEEVLFNKIIQLL